MPTITLSSLHKGVQATLQRLEAKDPGLGKMLKKAYGYAVFPNVGKAALVVGGSYGRGEVYERGKLVGYATIGQTTLGVQVGGDTFSEVIAFENKEAMERFKRGRLAFAANASAVLVKAGAAGSVNYEKGVAVLVYSRGGMLLEAAIGGQKFKFRPIDEARREQRQRQAQEAPASQGQEEDEESDESDEMTGAGGGGVAQAASRAWDFVKQHPYAISLAGLGLAGSIFWLTRMLRTSRDQSDSQDQSDSHESDENAPREQMSDEDDQENEGHSHWSNDDEEQEAEQDEGAVAGRR